MEMPGEKLVLKLWETVAEKGVGSLFKPWQMRREGRATIELKREELLVIAQAERDAVRIRRGELSFSFNDPLLLLEHAANSDGQPAASSPQPNLPVLANGIAIADTIRREANVTKALLHAEQTLEQDAQVPPEAKVDEDWLFKWRDSASQVSSEELQNLWGRLLAGEIKAPGNYSLRTLEFLKNLSQQEAEAIAKLSQFVVGEVVYRDAKELLEQAGVSFGFLLHMQQLGVVSGVEAIGLNVTWNSVDKSQFIRPLLSNSMVLIATAENPDHTITLPVYKLTYIGTQVFRLGKFDPHVEYLKKVGERLKTQNVKVELAQYIDIGPNEIRYFGGQEL